MTVLPPRQLTVEVLQNPAAVNCRGNPRQLTADVFSATNPAEAPSSISIFFPNLSKKPNQINSIKSQVSNYNAINLHFSCYKCFYFLGFE